MPEPQTAIPRSARPSRAPRPSCAPNSRIIDAFGTVRAEVVHLVALLAQPVGELVLEDVSGMVGGEGDAHVRLTRAGEPDSPALALNDPMDSELTRARAAHASRAGRAKLSAT